MVAKKAKNKMEEATGGPPKGKAEARPLPRLSRIATIILIDAMREEKASGKKEFEAHSVAEIDGIAGLLRAGLATATTHGNGQRTFQLTEEGRSAAAALDKTGSP